MKSVADQIVKRLQSKGRSFAFSAKDFLDLGSRGAVDMALSTLAKSGKIRRVLRGVYDYPKYSELLGKYLAPDFDQVAQAIARKTGTRIQPTGALAANLLGLSTQVPAKVVYLTDGRSRTIRFGTQTIRFQQTSPKELMSNRKIATTLYITTEQDRQLRLLSQALGAPMAALIREGIDLLLERHRDQLPRQLGLSSGAE